MVMSDDYPLCHVLFANEIEETCIYNLAANDVIFKAPIVVIVVGFEELLGWKMHYQHSLLVPRRGSIQPLNLIVLYTTIASYISTHHRTGIEHPKCIRNFQIIFRIVNGQDIVCFMRNIGCIGLSQRIFIWLIHFRDLFRREVTHNVMITHNKSPMLP